MLLIYHSGCFVENGLEKARQEVMKRVTKLPWFPRGEMRVGWVEGVEIEREPRYMR